MTATTAPVPTGQAVLEAVYRQAGRDELAAREELASYGLRDERRFDAWQIARVTLLQARGALYAGRTWTQDGGRAPIGQCHHNGAEAAYWERFNGIGVRTANGYVECRGHVDVGPVGVPS